MGSNKGKGDVKGGQRRMRKRGRLGEINGLEGVSMEEEGVNEM